MIQFVCLNFEIVKVYYPSNIQKKKSFLCVGLDTDIKKIPQHLLTEEDPIFAFNKAIIDSTAPYCVAYKPNLAFYESLGVPGLMAFEKTVAYLKANYPDQFIIADAKRGDIGNTSEMYARSFFDYMKVDAVTVAPYMGEDYDHNNGEVDREKAKKIVKKDCLALDNSDLLLVDLSREDRQAVGMIFEMAYFWYKKKPTIVYVGDSSLAKRIWIIASTDHICTQWVDVREVLLNHLSI